MRLQKRSVDAAAPKDKRYTLWDSDLGGFGVRVEVSGVKSYVVRYRPGSGGRSAPLRQVVIGRHGELTPDQARREAERLIGSVRLGADPAAQRSEERAGLTVRELGDLFLKTHVEAKRKPATLRNYKALLNQYVYPAIGTKRAAEVKRIEIARLHFDMARVPQQANRMLATLKSMYSFAERRGLTADNFNPARRIEMYPEKARERFLKASEIEKIGVAIRAAVQGRVADPRHPGKPASITPFAAAALRLLMFTGCRVSEIIKLRWEDYDAERGLLMLPDSKTGRKVVVLNGPAVEELEHLPRSASNPFVIQGKKAGAAMTDIDRPWRIVLHHAGLKGVRLHDLRHTFASVGAGASLGLPIVGKLLGHTQASTTARYAHLDSDPLRRASELIAGRIAASLDGGQE